MGFWVITIISFIFSVGVFADVGSVQEVCGPESVTVKEVKNVNDLEQSLCGFGDASSDTELRQLTNDTRRIIEKIKAPGSEYSKDISADPLSDLELLRSLKGISELLNSRRAPKEFRPVRQDKLSLGLSELIAKFGTKDSRKLNQQAYYESLRGVLAQTVTGAKVLECFEKVEKGVRKSVVEFPDPKNKTNNFSAMFEPRFDEKSGTYDKVITLSPNENPTQALISLTHEMQHACKTAENIELQAQYRSLQEKHDSNQGDQNETADALENFQAKINVRQTIDELAAYQVMPEILSELALYHPDYFCQNYAITSLFGNQVMSTGQFANTIESGFKDGSFIRTFIDTYSQEASFNPASLYQMNEEMNDFKRGADGKPLFRPEIKSEIMAAGFRVP